MRHPYPTNTEGPTAIVGETSAFYSLWDVGSGNSLGTCDHFEEVAEIVVALVGVNGAEYADDLDLSREDVEGNWERIATGPDLLRVVGFDGAREAR